MIFNAKCSTSFLVFIFLTCFLSLAQINEQDCPGAIPICQNQYTNAASYLGEGFITGEIDPVSSCLDQGENNDVWYIFTVQTSGDLSFLITPVSPTDDYDWAVYNLTNNSCGDIATDPSLEVSCNYSGTLGTTGPNGGSGFSSQGAAGTPFNDVIPVLAGETYVINISNFNDTQDGYTLDFSASTSSIIDNVPPQLQEIVDSVVTCGADIITIAFSENISCLSIDPADFTIIGPDGPHSIVSITSINCDQGAEFDSEYTLTISPPLTMPGNYTLQLISDVEDNCGNIQDNAQLNFDLVELLPLIAAAPATVCAGGNVLLDVSIPFSDPPITYTWAPDPTLSATNIADPVASPLVPTTYFVTVSDNGYCPGTAQITIDINIPSIIVTASPLSICQGEVTGLYAEMVNGFGPYTYEWANDPSLASTTIQTPAAAPTQITTYSVTITDAAGCQVNGSVTVDVTPFEYNMVPTGDTSICGGDSIFFNITPLQGTPPFTYSWTPDSTLSATDIPNPIGTPTGPTTYWVTISDAGGCSFTESITVDLNALSMTITATDPTLCIGENTVITGDVTTGTPPHTWSWAPSPDLTVLDQPVTQAFPLAPSTYAVTVTDSTGCQGFGSITIGVSDMVIEIDPLQPEICQGKDLYIAAIVDSGGEPYNYQWSPDPSLNLIDVFNPIATPQTDATYYITVTDDYGCIIYDTLDVVVNEIGFGVFASDTIICGGDTVFLNSNVIAGAAPLSFNWNPDPTLSSEVISDPWATPFSDVVYTCTMTDATGCFVTDSVQIVSLSPVISMVSSASSVCEGDTLNMDVNLMDGTPPITFSWAADPTLSNANIPDPFAIPLADNVYYVSVTDSTQCVTLDSVLVGLDTLAFSIVAQNSPICLGDSTQLITTITNGAPTYSYAWSPDSLLDNGNIPNPIATPTSTVEFFETISDKNGCTETESVIVEVVTIPISSFDLAPLTCVGDPVNITYTGTQLVGAIYDWDFGSGLVNSGSGAGPYEIMWPSPGQQIVTLQVFTPTCTSGVTSDTIQVNQRPVASIGALFYQCHGNNAFDFINAGSYGNTAAFLWTFEPDGLPPVSTDENPAGIGFGDAGVKTVTLTISDSGCTGSSDTAVFEIFPMPDPSFYFTSQNQQNCFLGNGFDFFLIDENQNGPGAAYWWTFEDGLPDTSSLTAISVSFTSPGTKMVILSVEELGCTAYDTQYVEVWPNPIANAGPDTAFCEGEGGALLLGSATGANAPYYYVWTCSNPPCGLSDHNSPIPFANPTSTQTYYLNVTDSYGCVSETDSVTVTVLPKPIVDAGPDLYLCAPPDAGGFLHGSVTNAPPPYTWEWRPGAGMLDSVVTTANDSIITYLRPDTTTIYTLVVTAGNGCTSDYNTVDTQSTVTVFVAPLPVADAGPDLAICSTDSVQLTGNASNAGPDYIYEWAPAIGLSATDIPDPTVFPPSTTVYTLVVWSNNCPSEGDSATVFVNTIPTLTASGLPNQVCVGDGAQLTALAGGPIGGQTFTFSWSPGATLDDSTLLEPMAYPTETTTYSVIATSSDGCVSAPATVTIFTLSTPIAEAGPDLWVCPSDTFVQLEGSFSWINDDAPVDSFGLGFSWTPSTTVTDTALLNPDAFPSQTTDYWLTVSYLGCGSSDSTTVWTGPHINTMIDADTTVICSEGSVTLVGSGGQGGATAQWTPPGGLSDPGAFVTSASPDNTTTYTLTVSEGGCSEAQSITVQVHPTPEMEIISSEDKGCVPFTINLTSISGNAIDHLWDMGDGTSIINTGELQHTYNEPGIYTVTVTGTGLGACDASTSFQVIVIDTIVAEFTSDPYPPVELTLPVADVQFTDLTEGAYSWLWDFGDGHIASEPHPAHNYTEPGEYYVTLQVGNLFGCTSEMTLGPYFVPQPGLLIENIFSPNGDGNNDFFDVVYNGNKFFYVEVWDRWGNLVFFSENKERGWNGQNYQTGSELNEGVYYYKVQVGEEEYVGHLTLLR